MSDNLPHIPDEIDNPPYVPPPTPSTHIAGSDPPSTEPLPPGEPPVNRDVPYVSQEGDILNCTMGNWDGTPDTYAYQWTLDAVDIGDGTSIYVTTPADVGKTASCTVSATNAAGTTEAPVSNFVQVAPAAGAETAAATAPEPEPEPEPKPEPEPSKKKGR